MSSLTHDIEHKHFLETVAKFVADQILPNHEAWEDAGLWDRSLFTEAGKNGLLGFPVPEEYDGFGASLHNAIVARYIYHYGSKEQKERWLPKMASGELVGGMEIDPFPEVGVRVRRSRRAAAAGDLRCSHDPATSPSRQPGRLGARRLPCAHGL